MLDDQKVIAQRDPDGALEIAAEQHQQLLHDFGVADIDTGEIDNIVVSGMGGSALAGIVVKQWLKDSLEIPFEINRDYSVPKYVNNKTLFIACSYSGNTEETIESLEHAEAAGANIVVIASGGKLSELAESKGYPMYLLPVDMQPRFAVMYGVRAMSELLEGAKLAAGLVDQLITTASFLEQEVDNLIKDSGISGNQAKQIALELAGKTPVVYGGPLMSSAAYKWKISFNENAKNVAYSNEFSELNHNEFMGWTSHPVDKPFGVVELRSNLEHPKIIKRFDVTNKILSGMMPRPIEVHAKGTSHIEQLLWTIQMGDFVSIYLAILNGVNPTPVKQIEALKKELA